MKGDGAGKLAYTLLTDIRQGGKHIRGSRDVKHMVFVFVSLPLVSALLSDQNPSELDALCPSPPGPSRPQRNYERIGGQAGTS